MSFSNNSLPNSAESSPHVVATPSTDDDERRRVAVSSGGGVGGTISTTSPSSGSSSSSRMKIEYEYDESTAYDGRVAKFDEIILFYTLGIGISVGWTCVLASLVYYTDKFGPKSYVYLNLSAFLPLVPITIIQAKYDTYYDRKFGNSLITYTFRGYIGFIVSFITLVFLMPMASLKSSPISLYMVTFLLGTSSSVLFGTLQQMASFVYKSCGRLQAALSTGYSSTPILVLLISIGTNFGSSDSDDGLHIFYFICASIVFFAAISFYFLMNYSRDILDSMSMRDFVITNNNDEQRGLKNNNNTVIENIVHSQHPGTLRETLMKVTTDYDQELPSYTEEQKNDNNNDAGDLFFEDDYEQNSSSFYKLLWNKSSLCCIILMINVVSNWMMASWMNRVKSVNPENRNLPQLLYYVRNIADLIGRPFSVLLWSPPKIIQRNKKNQKDGDIATTTTTNNTPNSSRILIVVGIIVTIQSIILLPLFYMYVSYFDIIFHLKNDLYIIFFVMIFSFVSGIITTILFQRAPYLLDNDEEGGKGKRSRSTQTNQINLLNVCYSIAILIGIIMNIIIQESLF